jgi:hypothetical protein
MLAGMGARNAGSDTSELTITSTVLPDGVQNSAYATTLTASGGQAPYSWSISAGNLPAGLTLAASTGAISGTPTSAGTSNFTVRVTDANSLTATQALSITISPAAPVNVSVALAWDASTSSVIGYNIYRGTTSGGPYVKLNSIPVVGTTYTNNTAVSGQTYYYVVKSVNSSNVESIPSNEVIAAN